MLSDVACEGNESSLLNCLGRTSSIECVSGEGAAVVCQGESAEVYYSVILFL